METPPTPTPIIVRGQAEIDALTAAAFTAAGLPACDCGRMMDGVQTQCWPCQSGNTHGGFYGPPTPRPRPAGPTRQDDYSLARIAELEHAVAYWRARVRALAGYEALGAAE